MKKLLAGVILLLTIGLVQAAAPLNRDSFLQCADWRGDYDSMVYDAEKRMLPKRLRMEEDSFDLSVKMDKAEFWMGIQEAAQDWDGYNRSVNEFNSDRRKMLRIEPKYDKLLKKYERKWDRIETLEGRMTTYCINRQIPQAIHTDICGEYISDYVTSYCGMFNAK